MKPSKNWIGNLQKLHYSFTYDFDLFGRNRFSFKRKEKQKVDLLLCRPFFVLVQGPSTLLSLRATLWVMSAMKGDRFAAPF